MALRCCGGCAESRVISPSRCQLRLVSDACQVNVEFAQQLSVRVLLYKSLVTVAIDQPIYYHCAQYASKIVLLFCT